MRVASARRCPEYLRLLLVDHCSSRKVCGSGKGRREEQDRPVGFAARRGWPVYFARGRTAN